MGAICPPHYPYVGCSFVGPTIGVVDGSFAQPGMVGEYLMGQAPVTYAGYPSIASVPAVPLVLTAGDWDVWAWVEVTNIIGGLSFWLEPVPAGFSNNMAGSGTPVLTIQPPPTGRVPWFRFQGTPAYAHLSLTTGLAFLVQVDQTASSTLPGGSLTLTAEARRRR